MVTKLTVFLMILNFSCFAQYATLHISAYDKEAKKDIVIKEIKVTVDDTLVKKLTLDLNGNTYLFVKDTGHKHKVKIEIDQYEPLIIKKVGIYSGRGKYITAKMVKVGNRKENNEIKSDN